MGCSKPTDLSLSSTYIFGKRLHTTSCRSRLIYIRGGDCHSDHLHMDTQNGFRQKSRSPECLSELPISAVFKRQCKCGQITYNLDLQSSPEAEPHLCCKAYKYLCCGRTIKVRPASLLIADSQSRIAVFILLAREIARRVSPTS